MKGLILGIESSTPACSVAVSAPDRLLAEVTLNVEREGSRMLSPAIRRILDDLSLSLQDISAVATSHGPGSFTGLRIGMATAKTLAIANDLPLYSMTTLLSLAYNARLSGEDVCPLLDARKGEVYAALYRFDQDDFSETISPVAVAPEKLSPRLSDRTVLIGDGASKYRRIFLEGRGSSRVIAPAVLSLPRASSLCALVHSGMVRESVEDIMGLEPLYVRKPEAELKWQERNRSTSRP